jgi:N-acyl-L-homoserine lactone synthetase
MAAVAVASASRFAEGVMQLLQRVDYRRADAPDDREAIFRLRYDAYRREGAVPASRARRIADEFDEGPNAWIFGVHVDGRLASSIRLSVASAQRSLLPALRVFSDLLSPEIAAGRTIVDPTRFVADQKSSRAHPALPYVTVRLAWLAAEFFNADLLLATVRVEHQAYYARVFGHRPVCAARPYPSLTKPISLMACDYPARRDQVLRRYPFFRSAFFERRMLFERHAQAPQRAA